MEDFADSSGLDYDAESINSILQEYAGDSRRASNRQLFTEQFEGEEAPRIHKGLGSSDSLARSSDHGLPNKCPQFAAKGSESSKSSPTNPLFSALLSNTPFSGENTQKEAISCPQGALPSSTAKSLPNTPSEATFSAPTAFSSTPSSAPGPRTNRRASQRRSVIELTLASHSNSENSLSSYHSFHDAKSDSTGSPGFLIHEDSGSASIRSMDLRKSSSVRTPVDRRTVVSMSSNVDANRSSLYNITAGSSSSARFSPAEKYPEPDITPKSHAYDVTDSLERPLFDASLLSVIADETALRSNRSTIRLSMSSGELLVRLGPSAEQKEPILVENASKKDLYNREKAGTTLVDLTAGIDSSTELPVMLYKVQNKSFDEGEQRWLVYEKKTMVPPGKPFIGLASRSVSRNSSSSSTYSRTSAEKTFSRNPQSARNSGENTSIRIPTPPERAFSRIPTSENRSRNPTPPEVSSKSGNSSAPSLREYYSPSIASASHAYFQQNFGNNIGDFRHNKPRDSPALVSPIAQPGPNPFLRDTVSQQTSHDHMLDDVDSSGLLDYDLEKYALHNRSKTYQRQAPQFHSWGAFAAMMALGLIVPPVYFLLSLGVFDLSGRTGAYKGLYYAQEKDSQQIRGKKYTPWQKMLSLGAGVFWFCVILAMIGVGLGLGLGREK